MGERRVAGVLALVVAVVCTVAAFFFWKLGASPAAGSPPSATDLVDWSVYLQPAARSTTSPGSLGSVGYETVRLTVSVRLPNTPRSDGVLHQGGGEGIDGFAEACLGHNDISASDPSLTISGIVWWNPSTAYQPRMSDPASRGRGSFPEDLEAGVIAVVSVDDEKGDRDLAYWGAFNADLEFFELMAAAPPSQDGLDDRLMGFDSPPETERKSRFSCTFPIPDTAIATNVNGTTIHIPAVNLQAWNFGDLPVDGRLEVLVEEDHEPPYLDYNLRLLSSGPTTEWALEYPTNHLAAVIGDPGGQARASRFVFLAGLLGAGAVAAWYDFGHSTAGVARRNRTKNRSALRQAHVVTTGASKDHLTVPAEVSGDVLKVSATGRIVNMDGLPLAKEVQQEPGRQASLGVRLIVAAALVGVGVVVRRLLVRARPVGR